MARNASYEQCEKWFAEAEREKRNAGANLGFLVTQRAGVGYPRAGQWWAFATLGDLALLRYGLAVADSTLLRLPLSNLVKLIHG